MSSSRRLVLWSLVYALVLGPLAPLARADNGLKAIVYEQQQQHDFGGYPVRVPATAASTLDGMVLTFDGAKKQWVAGTGGGGPSTVTLQQAYTNGGAGGGAILESGAGGPLALTAAANASVLTLTGGTVTTSNPILSATQTWNAGGVTFTGALINVTNTASAAGSLLLDTQIGGTSVAAVTKNGALFWNNSGSAVYLWPTSGSNRVTLSTTDQGITGASLQAGSFTAIAGGASRAQLDTLTNPPGLHMDPLGQVGWGSVNNNPSGSLVDTALTRVSPNVIAGGSGAIGDASGTFRVTAVQAPAATALGLGGNAASQWSIASAGHLLALADNTYDIGAAGASRPRNVYIAGKLTVAGAIDPTSVSLSSGTALFFDSADGSTAPVSPANHGRIRYLDGTGWQVSSSGGAYTTLATGGGTLQTAYNGGATIAEAGGVPVAISSTTANNGNVLTVTKNPGGAQSGYGLLVSMGVNSTSAGLYVDNNGSGSVNGAVLLDNRGANDVPSLYVAKDPTGAQVGEGIFIQMGGSSGVASGAGLRIVQTTGTATGGAIQIVGGSFAASAPMFDGSQSWNNAGATFVGVSVNVFDTASSAGSLLLQLQTGSVNKFTVDKAGNVSISGKLTVTGAIDPTSVSLSSGTALFFDSADGSTAPVSPANHGRIRYLDGTGWQVSSSGGAYATLATSGATSLQTAYNGGASIVEAGGVPVAISSTTADNSDVLTVNKAPSSSHSGNGITVTIGSNSNGGGSGINVTTSGDSTAGSFTSNAVGGAIYATMSTSSLSTNATIDARNSAASAGNVAEFTKNPVGSRAGDGVRITMGGGSGITTGSALHVVMTTNQASGNALAVDLGAATNALTFNSTGTLAWGTGLSVPVGHLVGPSDSGFFMVGGLNQSLIVYKNGAPPVNVSFAVTSGRVFVLDGIYIRSSTSNAASFPAAGGIAIEAALGFYNGAGAGATIDVGISRVSGSVIGFGNGATGDVSKFIQALGGAFNDSTTSGVDIGFSTAGAIQMGSAVNLAWTNGTNGGGTKDTNLSRDAAGVIDFGTGAASSTAGSWKATNGTLSGSLLSASNGTVALGSASNGFKSIYLDYTNTATVGAVTINKPSGTVNMAAVATTMTVTNSLVTANSHIMVTLASDPGVAVSVWTVGAAGSFTINVRPALVNQTAIDFVVVSAD